MTKTQLSDAARIIINTRDFCGNEREAFRDYCADEGIPYSDAGFKAAVFAANNEWRNGQKAAGVPARWQLW